MCIHIQTSKHKPSSILRDWSGVGSTSRPVHSRGDPLWSPNRHQPKPPSPVILSRSEGSPSTGRERLRGPQQDRAVPSLRERRSPRPLHSSSHPGTIAPSVDAYYRRCIGPVLSPPPILLNNDFHGLTCTDGQPLCKPQTYCTTQQSTPQ